MLNREMISMYKRVSFLLYKYISLDYYELGDCIFYVHHILVSYPF